MKLFEMHASVDKDGRITIPAEMLVAAGMKPGDELCITLAVRQEESNLLNITPHGLEAAVRLSGWQEDDGDVDLILPNALLEAAEIPEGSDLEIFCTERASRPVP